MTAVVRGNALQIPLRDKSVQLIITSPPYFALRSYRDDGEHYDGQIGSESTPQAFLEALWAVTKECWRVLADDGVMFVNLGDKRSGSGGHNNSGISAKSTLRDNGHVGGGPKIKATLRNAPDRYNQAAFGRPKSKMALPHRYFIGCMDGLADPDGIGWIARQDMVWNKPNGLPESVTDRVRDSHEYWFMLTKQERYFAAVDEVREPHAPKTLTHRGGGESWGNEANPDNHWGDAKVRRIDPLGKLPGSVWTIASEPLAVPDWLGVDHFAAFPQEWPRRLILGWSPSGICTACGQGRRPVVATSSLDASRPQARRALALAKEHGLTDAHLAAIKAQGTSDVGRAAATQTGTGKNTAEVQRLAAEAKVALGGYTREFLLERPTSFGYACACPTSTAATRPAVVLDPFGGTGTTAMVARALGRTGISLDLSADYCRLAKWRIFQSGHAAKARERTNREAQGSLL